MKTVFCAIVIICNIGSILSQSCYSTCEQISCSAYGDRFCTGCPTPELTLNNSECVDAAAVVLDSIDGNWNSGTQYMQHLEQTGNTYTSSFALGWDYNLGISLNELGGGINEIGFYFANLPINHYQLEFRASGYLNYNNFGCLYNLLHINWFNDEAFPNPSLNDFIVSATFLDTQTALTIVFQNIGSNSGVCQFVTMLDFTLLAFLCSDNCRTCNATATNCTSCGIINSTQNFLFLNTSVCWPNCTYSYFSDSPNFICDACDVSCFRCFGIITNCTQCNIAGGYVFSYLSSSQCVNPCPAIGYFKFNTFMCQPCSVNCFSCFQNPFHCTSCTFSPGAGQLYLTSQNRCVSVCPASTYYDTVNMACPLCNESCLTCFGPDSSSCFQCTNVTDSNNVTTMYYLNVGSTICSSTCPDGQFISASIANLCQTCSSICIYCSVSSRNCTDNICPASFYFYQGLCLQICVSGTYGNVVTMVCSNCHAGCATCFGSSLSNCYSCTKDPSTNISYYLQASSTICTANCPSGQFNSGSLCQLCSFPCVQCSGTSTYCINGVCQYGYYFYNNLCLFSCGPGTFGNQNTWACSACYPACATCFNASISACYSCQPSNGTNYYLNVGTTTCSSSCPTGQFPVGTQCQNCNSICNTCSVSPSNCTSCSIASFNIFYYNFTCLGSCPNGTYANNINSTFIECSKCHSWCLTCFGPNYSTCTACSNITIGNLTSIYYLAMKSNTCNSSCPIGQFISSSVPNVCQLCSTYCIVCNQSACLACQFNCFLLSSNGTCWKQCPVGFYGDPVIVFLASLSVNTSMCVSCFSSCLSCYGASSRNCTACRNVTLANGSTLVYYFDYTLAICSLSCPVGFINNESNNSCLQCPQGCLSCNFSICLSCLATPNQYFLLSNSCVSNCPSNMYANLTNSSCQSCPFFLVNQVCLQSCPSGYIQDQTSSSPTCISTVSNTTQDLSLKLRVVISKQTKNLELFITPSSQLSQICTALTISNNMQVSIVAGRRRLLNSVPLTILNVSISSDYSTITVITTSFHPIDYTSSSIAVKLQPGALLAANGVAFSNLSPSLSLNNPTFIKSYYQAYVYNIQNQIYGIVFTIFSLLLLIIPLVIMDENSKNESISFFHAIQLIGLSRIRQFPVFLQVFNVQSGFSYSSFLYIPNVLTKPFPSDYQQAVSQSVELCFSTQNLIFNFGGLLQVSVCLQLLLLCYFFCIGEKQIKKKRSIFFQKSLIDAMMVVLIYGSCLDLLSLHLNSISSNYFYLFSILFSLIVLLGCCIYLVYVVPNNFSLQFYRVSSFLKTLAIVMLSIDVSTAILMLNFSEFMFVAIDLLYFRREGILLYLIDKLAILSILNYLIFATSLDHLLLILGSFLGIVALIKCYHVIQATQVYMAQKTEKIDNSISASVNLSISEKGQAHIHQILPVKPQPVGDHYSKQKDSSFQSFNEMTKKSSNFSHNQSIFHDKYPFNQNYLHDPEVINQDHKVVRRKKRRKEALQVLSIDKSEQILVQGEIIKVEADKQNEIDIIKIDNNDNRQQKQSIISIVFNDLNQEHYRD